MKATLSCEDCSGIGKRPHFTREQMKLTLFASASVFLMVSVVGGKSSAQETDSTSPTKPAPVDHVAPVAMTVRGVSPSVSGIDKTIRVQVDSLQEAVRRDRIDP